MRVYHNLIYLAAILPWRASTTRKGLKLPKDGIGINSRAFGVKVSLVDG